jgi:hypothetical protein
MLQTLCTLSHFLKGNTDCIEIIINKKKIIEKNETLIYHMTNGLRQNYLTSYSTFSIILNGEKHYELRNADPTPRGNFIIEETIYDTFNKIKKDKEIYNGFFSTVQVNHIEKIWNYSSNEELKKDKRFCLKIVIECIGLSGFVKVKEVPRGTAYLDLRSWGLNYFREATLKEKMKVINLILRIHGIIYLDLIKTEYKQGDILHAIILTNEGRVESIMGGGARSYHLNTV